MSSMRRTGAEIENSPFKLRAIEKKSEAHKVVIPEDFHSLLVKPIPLGSEVNFDINTSDAGYGTLKINEQNWCVSFRIAIGPQVLHDIGMLNMAQKMAL